MLDKRIQVIIVDDEPLARKGLALRLAEFPEIEIVGQAANGREAIEKVEQLKPDAVFLDIQMPGLSGFEVVQRLIEKDDNLPNIIFVTAFDQYAIKAFEVHALDYLLKPLREERIAESIEKLKLQIELKKQEQENQKLSALVSQLSSSQQEDAIEAPQPSYAHSIIVREGQDILKIQTEDILWIDAAGDYMCIHTEDGQTHIVRKTMKELEQSLCPETFLRVHRSSIVNAKFVKKLRSADAGDYYLVLQNDNEVKVSRSYRDRVKTHILGT
nr:LytTR family DNA-binding domain-containing protein [Algicola sagamiensis]